MILAKARNSLAVMPSYRRMCKFAILIHFLALAVLYKNNEYFLNINTVARKRVPIIQPVLAEKLQKTNSRKIITS